MPRLWILSDLHLETVPRPEAFRPDPSDFDVLAAAGDIWEGDVDRALRFVADLADGKPVILVLGNHEFWHRVIPHEREKAWKAAPRYGVTLLDNSAETLAGVRFVGGTLWSDGRLAGTQPVPDQPIIEPMRGPGRAGRVVTTKDIAKLHRWTLDAIEASAYPAKDGSPLVVVTHYAPHSLCLPKGQRTGWAAGNAASDLSYLTDTGQIALWVHGHLHHTVDLNRPGGTRIVCNPAGLGFANPAFRDDWVVEV